MSPTRSVLPRRRRRGRRARPFWSVIQPLENRLMLTGNPVANNDAYTVFHDRGLIATTSQSGVLANDTDPNGFALTALLVTNVRHGTLTLKSDGSFVYMPAAGYSSTDSFTYKDYDGSFYSSPATVTITVQETAPVANGSSFTIGHDRTLSGAVSASDAENDPLVASLATNVQHGTLTLNAN